ncbi:MAG TPA: hypothetical protein ENK06_09940 [Gammaproteobacteria bacterium]|nr:hypothetical protein [Gammaproteobacteria bacterium]
MAHPYQFSLCHIDVARNSTDDFNPFHDKTKWQNIAGNPFRGPIVLGFQLVALLSQEIVAFRQNNGEQQLLDRKSLRFSCYQLKFASAVKPEDIVTVALKKSKYQEDAENSILSNRLLLKNNGKLAIMGFKKESRIPLVARNARLKTIPDIDKIEDRTFVDGGSLFFKRKFLNTANAKNFLVGSLIEQSEYFDEIEERVNFPEIFIVALISCGLLERAQHLKHDFLANPMVYVSMAICINRVLVRGLRSNDRLGLLVDKVETDSESDLQVFQCDGLLKNNQLVFSCLVELAPLEKILKEGN